MNGVIAGEHEKFTSRLWKQGVGSTIHCVAGDATGIIPAAAITALLGLPMGIDLIVEYLVDPHRPAEEFDAQLPAQVRWEADNYLSCGQTDPV